MRVRFGVLGPLLAVDATGPVDLKGPRHRAVLARLLIARGRVVPAETLINDLWAVPPERAAGAVQTFVGALRRSLEPSRLPRTQPRLLVTEGSGYALRLPPEAVDAWRFEEHVRTAAGDAQHVHAGAALELALDLWRGPAYAEVADQAWARAEIDRLDELHLLAVQLRAEVMLTAGRAAEVVPDLEALVKQHPLREEARRLLALALYRSGRQGDALATLRESREALADELGLDPGPVLRQLETDVLRHAPALTSPQPRRLPSGSSALGSSLTGRSLSGRSLIGRDDALAALEAAVVTRNHLGLALVSGEPGIGKTALVAEFARGRRTLWYRNPSDFGVPSPTGDPATAQARWHRAVADHLAGLARVEPLVIVVEDLHAADPGTLTLIEHLTDPPLAAPILLVATHRSTDPPHALLSRLAQADPLRLTLGGLPQPQTHALVRATLGHDVDDTTAAAIQERSGGNPFYVRELARLIDTGSPGVAPGVAPSVLPGVAPSVPPGVAPGVAGVPPGVRDVVRHRLAQLPAPTHDVVRRAAILGPEFDLALLPAEGLHSGGEMLDAIESAVERGFVEEIEAGRFRFAHALVRDAVYEGLSRTRRAAWHAEAAAAVRRLRPDDVEAFAHHLDLAASSDPTAAGLASTAGSAAARYAARVAAEQAERRFEPHRAVRWWRTALRHGGGASARTRAELIMGLARSLAVTGELGEARRLRGAAIELAAGDAALTTRVICAFDVPASWAANDDPAMARQIADAAAEALRSPHLDMEGSPGSDGERLLGSGGVRSPGSEGERSRRVREDRCRLLATIAMELRNEGGAAAREAAEEAVRLARGLDDPALLAYALNGLFLQTFHRAGLASERADIGAELLDLAERHGLVSYRVLGHLLLIQTQAALDDFAGADRHAEAADRLAEEYRIPLVDVFTAGYRALRIGKQSKGGHAEMPGVDLRLDRPATADAMLEARLCFQARKAIARGDRAAMARLADLLAPAAGERAAGSALVDQGPVADVLHALANTA